MTEIRPADIADEDGFEILGVFNDRSIRPKTLCPFRKIRFKQPWPMIDPDSHALVHTDRARSYCLSPE